MIRKSKKLLSVLLSVLMIVTLMPTGVLAETIDTQEAFVTAVNNSKEGDTIYLGAGEFDLNGFKQEKTTNKELTFIGQGADKTTLLYGGEKTGEGALTYTLRNASKVVFKNVTMKDKTADEVAFTDKYGYCRGLSGDGISYAEYDNVVFEHTIGEYGDNTVIFNECTFKSKEYYDIVAYEGKNITFNKCVFEGNNNKGWIQLYRRLQENVLRTVTVNDCSFDKGTSISTKTPIYAYDNTSNGGIWNIFIAGNNINVGDKFSPNSASENWMYGVFSGESKQDTVTLNGVKVWENGAKIEAPSVPEAKPVTIVTPSVNEEKGITSDIVEAITSNSAVAEFENTGLESAINIQTEEKLSVKIEVVKASSTNNSLTFEVAPYAGETKIENDQLNGETAISFRLPLTNHFTKYAKVTHGTDIATVKVVSGNEGEKYVDLSSTHFSEFTVEPVEYPLNIRTAEDLVALSEYVNACHNMAGMTIVLENDIDMSGVDFNPIGVNGAPFSGTFDGKDNKISNLNVNKPELTGVGLFGYAGTGSLIKNIKNVSATIIGKKYVGGICGNSCGQLVNNYFNGTITANEEAGGIAGFMICGGISDCTVNLSTITAKVNRAGGIVDKADVQNTYFLLRNTVKDTTITSAGVYEANGAGAGALISQLMLRQTGATLDGVNSYLIQDNNIINVKTITSGVESFNPIGTWRAESQEIKYFDAEAISSKRIARNHWEPATTPDSYNMVDPNNSEQFVTIDNFYAVAEIVGGIRYASLEEAISDAKAEDTIKLLDDVTVDSTLVFDKSVTLDGNSKKLTSNLTNASIIKVKSGDFTMKDLTVYADNRIEDGNNNKNGVNADILFETDGKVEITGCTFDGITEAYYNVLEFGQNTKVANGTNISNNTFKGTSMRHNCINMFDYVNNATVNVNGNKFESIETSATNPVRVSNYSSVNVTLNMNDNEYSYVAPAPEKFLQYAGFVLVQNNEGTSDNMTLSFKNLKVNGYDVTTNNTNTHDQVVYVYTADKKVVYEGVNVEGIAMPAAKIDTKYFDTLPEAIEAINNGDTITIIQSINNAHGIKYTAGKDFTIDFNGNTYLLEMPGAGSTGYPTQGFHLENGNITFKNGTIACTEANKNFTWASGDAVRGVAMLIQNYTNLTLDNMVIDGTNIAHNGNNVRYVVSNNSGTVNIRNSKIIACNGDFAIDACKFQNYAAPTVTLSNTTINGKVEITGGEMNLNSGAVVNGMVRVGENKEGTNVKDGSLHINEGATVNCQDSFVAVFGKNTLSINGTVNGLVATNGNAYNGGSVILINNGAHIVNENDVAVYMPNGELRITGGTIEGATAVYFKSTKLDISGGTLIATGAQADYKYNGDGSDPTGDALVIDSCNYPNGIENVSVSGGTFKSLNNNAIASFTSKGADRVEGFITGGTFSSEISSELCASGFTPFALEDGSYTVKGPENIIVQLYLANDKIKANLSGGDQYKSGSSVEVTAEDNLSLYKFAGWYNTQECTGDVVNTSSTYKFTANQNITLYAKYELRPEYNATQSDGALLSGSLTINNVVAGTTITYFENATSYDADNEIVYHKTVTVNSNNINVDKSFKVDNVRLGTTVTVKAPSSGNYQWNNSNDVLLTGNKTYSFIFTSNTAIKLNKPDNTGKVFVVLENGDLLAASAFDLKTENKKNNQEQDYIEYTLSGFEDLSVKAPSFIGKAFSTWAIEIFDTNNNSLAINLNHSTSTITFNDLKTQIENCLMDDPDNANRFESGIKKITVTAKYGTATTVAGSNDKVGTAKYYVQSVIQSTSDKSYIIEYTYDIANNGIISLSAPSQITTVKDGKIAYFEKWIICKGVSELTTDNGDFEILDETNYDNPHYTGSLLDRKLDKQETDTKRIITIRPTEAVNYDFVALYKVPTSEDHVDKVEDVPFISITDCFKEIDGANHKIGFTISYSLPPQKHTNGYPDYYVEAVGFYYLSNYGESVTLEQIVAKNHKSLASDLKYNNGVYTLHMNLGEEVFDTINGIDKYRTTNVVGFMTYKDPDNISHTIYTETMSKSWNSFSN